MRYVIILGVLAGLLMAVPAAAQDPASGESSEQLLAAARAQLAATRLDSAAALLRRVAQAPARAVADRIQAWVLLGVVDFYRSGDSAAAVAFRYALALDPGFEVAALEQREPAAARILAAERAALAAPVAAPAPRAAAEPVDCVRKCPEGVRPPRFTYFPRLELHTDIFGRWGMSAYLVLQAVISADGLVEPESVWMAGGTAQGLEGELRQALSQARFQPGRADGVPVRARVAMRFDFRAEGLSSVRYTYQVIVR
jgi:hypothetical protein